jgi:hypothetical protein
VGLGNALVGSEVVRKRLDVLWAGLGNALVGSEVVRKRLDVLWALTGPPRRARLSAASAFATAATIAAAEGVDRMGPSMGELQLLPQERGELDGEGEAGREAGNELALLRRTIGAFTIEARLAYSRVLLESSK